MPDTSYCTWRDYPDLSRQQMTRTPVAVQATQLKHIPVGSLFIDIKDIDRCSYPPVVCIKTDCNRKGFASFKFGISSNHSILTSDDTLVIPLCGDYSG